MDGNCYVDVNDYVAFALEWGRGDCDGFDDCNGADLTADGVVDVFDLAKLLGSWLYCTSPNLSCDHLWN